MCCDLGLSFLMDFLTKTRKGCVTDHIKAWKLALQNLLHSSLDALSSSPVIMCKELCTYSQVTY